MSLDLDSRKVYATRNGKPAGVIFVDMPRDHLLYPALSMRRNQKVTFNLGASPFRYADKLAFPWHSMLDDKQKMGLEKLYEHYKRIGSELSEVTLDLCLNSRPCSHCLFPFLRSRERTTAT